MIIIFHDNYSLTRFWLTRRSTWLASMMAADGGWGRSTESADRRSWDWGDRHIFGGEVHRGGLLVRAEEWARWAVVRWWGEARDVVVRNKVSRVVGRWSVGVVGDSTVLDHSALVIGWWGGGWWWGNGNGSLTHEDLWWWHRERRDVRWDVWWKWWAIRKMDDVLRVGSNRVQDHWRLLLPLKPFASLIQEE